MPTLRRRVAAIARVWRGRKAAQYQKSRDPQNASQYRAQAWHAGQARGRADHYGDQEALPGLWRRSGGSARRALFLVGFAGAMRRSELVGLDVVNEVERTKNRTKSRVRARVEHPFLIIKRVFGFSHVHYRGLAKMHTGYS